MGLQESFEAFAADLFFAFDDERQVARQFGAGFEIRFDGLEVGEVLALVITSTATEQRAAIDAWLEGRSFPEFERFGRLNIVVAVDEEMAASFGASVSVGGHDYGVTFGRANAGLKTDVAGVVGDPLRTSV